MEEKGYMTEDKRRECQMEPSGWSRMVSKDSRIRNTPNPANTHRLSTTSHQILPYFDRQAFHAR
jgi:hypothetical protein